MNSNQITVADDMVVTMGYLLTTEDNQEIDRSDDQDPFEFMQGHGQIIPGLEKALVGMAVGDEKRIVIAPVDGYGEIDLQNFDRMSRDAFPPDLDLQPGVELQMRDTENGKVFQATISEIDGDQVTLDFNHPLAGETLVFQVKIIGLRPATSEELDHGHVHGSDHHHH